MTDTQPERELQTITWPCTDRLVSEGDDTRFVVAHADGPCYTLPEDYPSPLGELTLVHLDAAIAVVNKPAYLPSENTRHIKDSARQRLTALLTLRGEENGVLRLPHRLDYETSGLLIFARTAQAMRSLAMQFEARKVHKTYTADVIRTPPSVRGTIDLPLSSDPQRLPMQRIDYSKDGKQARTTWEVISTAGSASGGVEGARHFQSSRLLLRPESGRRHQLRMHCLALGCPISGDALYLPEGQRRPMQRLHLHATEVTFTHPLTGELVSFRSDPSFSLPTKRQPSEHMTFFSSPRMLRGRLARLIHAGFLQSLDKKLRTARKLLVVGFKW
eukprot:CAMPEP_0115846346 /NCGR_PEP_ID=MMETSP0287-20121206/9815_1 /TAXON_ID=412157 /ORGANISM="Chrysochromulina rotalis, Strain UIO044" /LENGTH=329 /DNA_ID=CAMNT_0003300137 /DNA_START=10 /DNA_END=996 /DNA_ORIENTATION=-